MQRSLFELSYPSQFCRILKRHKSLLTQSFHAQISDLRRDSLGICDAILSKFQRLALEVLHHCEHTRLKACHDLTRMEGAI